MDEVFSTIIVTAANAPQARNIAATFPGGPNMFVGQLTSNPAKAPPATHFFSSGEMDAAIPLAVSSIAVDVSGEPWRTAAARVGLFEILVNDD